MSKVFTIAEGLENLGAMKTGGQGSIYRAKRIGPIITAVKLLPTPILSEDMGDKNYRDFRNEVEKLKKVNELANPNVVRILNFGISETGSFPFIEMEFIEGPDLEELLKPPHDPVFTVKETVRVAEHLANALAHCHRVDVKHGDIKSNNVKFNIHTGNYVLLDFGLALMSDEQRRTSLRHAGAVEFMAPEQSEGQLLFQSDVYSYGIVIYELLAGQVPFPLENKNETTRNMVLVAHMETPPPEILPLRAAHIPKAWPEDRQQHEMKVPQWLLDMIRKCTDKDPGKRFANGVELYEYILHHSTSISESSELTDLLRQENKQLKEENVLLQRQLAGMNAKPLAIATVSQEQPTYHSNPLPAPTNNRKWVIPTVVAALALLVAVFFLVRASNHSRSSSLATSDTVTDAMTADGPNIKTLPSKGTEKRKTNQAGDTIYIEEPTGTQTTSQQNAADQQQSDQNDNASQTDNQEQQDNPLPHATGKHYVVASGRAYFHNQPDPDTRRDAYLTPSDEVMTAIDEQGDFVYIVFTNDQGQTSKGWVPKRDLKPVE
jgi:serine/threonine-protein kinase